MFKCPWDVVATHSVYVILISTLFGDDATVLRERGFQVLLLVNLSPSLGTALLAPILDLLTGPYGVTETEIGLVITAFTAPSIVLVPLAGVLADTYGRKPVIIVGLLLFGIGGVAIPLTADFWAFLALRVVQGIGAAGLVPVIITSVGDMFDGDAEAAAQGFRFASSGVSQFIFPLLAGTFVVLAWQYPFGLYAVAIPTAVVVYYWFEEPASTQDSAANGRLASSSYLRDLVALARKPRVASILLATAMPPFIYIGFLTYNSFIVIRLIGASPQQSGLIVAILSIVTAVSATQAGRVTARAESRVPLLVGSNVCLGIGITLFGSAWSLWSAVAGVILLGVGFGISLSLYRSIVTGFTTETLRGGLVSMGETINRFFATISPVVMGLLITFARPSLGLNTAVRWTVVGIGLTGAVVGVGCVLFADHASPVAIDVETAD